MANTIKDKLEHAGEKVAATAKTVGHTIAEKAEQAADWVKEKTGIGENKEACETGKNCEIREHMDVIGSCGNKLGVVDHVEGNMIKLTRNDSADGQHHFVPKSFVDHVDSHVHLNKTCGEAKQVWNVPTTHAGV